MPYTLVEEGDLAEPPFDQGSPLAPEPPALADIRNYQQQPSESPGSQDTPSPNCPLDPRPCSRLICCLLQNSELLARVKSLESCECRRPVCMWEGTQREDGATWDKDDCTTCICLGRGRKGCPCHPTALLCPGCEYDGQRYQDGDAFLATSNPCMNCSCLVRSCAPGRGTGEGRGRGARAGVTRAVGQA
uniref:VWFC domain-containing protein n=1 Tax=Gopherus agassizii TaxID=38772 RepID=A0A452HHA3_9SAUR